MAKTGLFGFGYINEGIFYGKLGDLLGRDVTAQDKQLIHRCVQDELDKGLIEYFTCDRQGTISASKVAPKAAKEILAKAVSIGMTDRQNQEILAYVCQQPGQRWSTVYVGARPAVLSILSAYHIGYLNFRSFREANEFICGIHDILLPGEQWGFAKSEENPALIRRTTRYQILESYLRHTFSKLMLEYNKPDSDNYGKIVFSQDKKYCYFNTGLLTKYAQDLYLTGEVYAMKEGGIFTCNNPRFVDSKIELVKIYGFAQRDIDPGPGVAAFFRNISDIVYDPSITIDFTESKLEHIIDDGIRRNRFPRKYTVTQSGKPIPPWSLAQMLNNSIKIACMMAQRNYKYVIPQYRPAGVEYVGGKRVQYEGQIQFLMPIYLSADYFSPPDFALVLSKRDGFYVPETILLLPWAYNNARILCKPDNSWLNPNTIDPEDLLHEEEPEEGEFEESAIPAVREPIQDAAEPATARAEEEKPAAKPPVERRAEEQRSAKPAPEKKPEAPAEKPTGETLKGPAPVRKAPESALDQRNADLSPREQAENAGQAGEISRNKPGERRLKDMLGKPMTVRVESRARTEDACPPAPVHAPATESPAKPAGPVDDKINQVVTMTFTGTTAAKALKGEGEGVQGTISLKRLSGHKALEFHGLTAKVRILSQNTCGGSYQCELVEAVDDVLARRKAPAAKPAAQNAQKPAKPKSGWAWADPTNIFSQRPTVVESFRDLAVGQRYNATVRDLVPYGAFVDIGYAEGNILLHKSQYAEGALLSVGDVLTVWIHALDTQNKKVQATMHRPA